jgi:hypothetical protein
MGEEPVRGENLVTPAGEIRAGHALTDFDPSY